MEKQRCKWCTADVLYQEYHDKEWGIPVYDDKKLFEMLILEGAQAGLSWITILKKREAYREAFSHFDVAKVANYNDEDIADLLKNSRIIRNKLKIKATIKNAQIFQQIQKEFGSFSNYIWAFVNNKIIVNHYKSVAEMPAFTAISTKISKNLYQRGMRFVGEVIIYAFMQAIGMVNDHTQDCFKYTELVKSLLQKNIKYTNLAYERIRKNLHLKSYNNTDIEKYCVAIISNAAHGDISKQGKNYYIKSEKYNAILTVNSCSFTVITAKQLR